MPSEMCIRDRTGIAGKIFVPGTSNGNAYAQLFKILEVFIGKRSVFGGDEGGVGGAVGVRGVQKAFAAFWREEGAAHKVDMLFFKSFKRVMPVVEVNVFHPPVGISAHLLKIVHIIANGLAVFHAVKAGKRKDAHPDSAGGGMGQQGRDCL